jgi:predicted RNA binding protein YcfA (HicA-like mRNA interferase family)
MSNKNNYCKRKSIEDLLKLNGFDLTRKDGKHFVWKDSSGICITIPKSGNVTFGVFISINIVLKKKNK